MGTPDLHTERKLGKTWDQEDFTMLAAASDGLWYVEYPDPGPVRRWRICTTCHRRDPKPGRCGLPGTSKSERRGQHKLVTVFLKPWLNP